MGFRPLAAAPASARLVAAIGRWDLCALLINTVIGSGIFGLPLLVTARLGSATPWAYLLAAAGIAVIVLCFAEVGAQFRLPGGPYLYARQAFGRFVGVQVGWVTWLMRITAAAATARIFTDYLGVLWPPAAAPPWDALLITALFAALALVNWRGVRAGTQASDVLLIAKLAPLAVFVAVGLWFVRADHFYAWPAGPGSVHARWFQAVLLLIFAFGGFDNAVFPASELRDPRRDVPFALFAGMLVVVVFYLLIQIVFQGTLTPAAATSRPLAAAARAFMGPAGAWMIAGGAMLSIWGWFAATILGTPRLTFAMAEQGDLPRVLAAVHPRFRTPHLSILLYVGASWALALTGSFAWNASLSSIARLLAYGATCASLPIFRRRDPEAAVFRVPGGWLLPAIGMAFCFVLLTQMGRTDLLLLLATAALASLSWLMTRSPIPPLK